MKTAAKRMKQRSAGKPDIELGKRIRLRRVEQKISQAELGDKLGVSFQQVQKYEKGVNRVGAARLQQIASALDVPVTFFYDGDNKSREVESLLFLDSAFSLRLLRAYSKIKDQTVQRFATVRRACADRCGPRHETEKGRRLSLRSRRSIPSRTPVDVEPSGP
jgi:transcriptional regulator with XRE-family HTH domain